MNAKDPKSKISYVLAEFADRCLEKEFFNHEVTHTIRYLKPILLAIALIYMLFFIPEYFLIQSAKKVFIAFICRAVFFTILMIFFVRLKRLKSYLTFYYWVMICETAGSLILLYIFHMYDSRNFAIQAFGVSLIVLIIFFIPNRWIYQVLISIFITVIFFIFTANTSGNLDQITIFYTWMYFIMVVIMSSISSFRVNYYKRIQYMNDRRLLKLSITDPLTGAYNRLKFDEELDRWINYARRNKIDLALILFDFDDFKMINDSFGHVVGDKVLINTTHLIRNQIRDIDILARWGGEEFAILLPGLDIESAVDLCEKIRTEIAAWPIAPVGKLTCSFGIVSLNTDDSISSYMQRVDKLLYTSKKMGKNRISY